MSISVVTVKFNNDKSCFISLSASVCNSKVNKGLQVFELDGENGRKVYLSWSGRQEPGKENLLCINGVFAAKLGIKDGDQLIIRPVQTAVPECRRVFVEPVSYDDWEIMDRHTGFIESNLLDTVRVVQSQNIYPIWVDKSVCLFIKIGSTVPVSDCTLLVNQTEVIVSPKVRSSTIGKPSLDEPMKTVGGQPKARSPGIVEEPVAREVGHNLETPYLQSGQHYDEYDAAFDTKFSSTDSELSLPEYSKSHNDRKTRERSPYDLSGISSHWRSLASFLGFKAPVESLVDVSDSEDQSDYEDGDYFEQEMSLQSGLNMILRVQNLKYNIQAGDHLSKEIPQKKGSDSPRKNGSISPRKQSRESPSKGMRNYSQPRSNFRINYFPQQPSTVYMDMTDVEKQLDYPRTEIPHMFYARLHKLTSPSEQIQERLNTSNSSGKSQTKNGKKNPEPTSPDLESRDLPGQSSKSEHSANVRVIVLDRRRKLCNDQYSAIVKRVLEEQPVLKGHLLVPDMLRRFLNLGVTSRVWVQTIKPVPMTTTAYSLYPLGNVPSPATNDMIGMAFRQWLDTVTTDYYSLVVFQGLFLRFPVFPDKYVECQLTYNEPRSQSKTSYTLLHPGALRNATLAVVSGSRTTDITHPVVQPMLAYTGVNNIDPMVMKTDLSSIGGINDLIQHALMCIEICLGSRRLYRDVFLTTPGLLNGMLLLTGPKGSGKTTLANALCKKLTELPNLAYATAVDCKPLRGKKVDTIQKKFELLFDEAVWRQPAVILLDDLDHIAGAPAGPEFEMTGEALYAARIAEVVKDLLRKDIRNMSNIAVVATSQSRSSLHPILVSSRGTHLVQEVINIAPPDKTQRHQILDKLLRTQTGLSDQTIGDLDLDGVAQRTEGYVARDLEKVLSRAMHAHMLQQGRGIQEEANVHLEKKDLEVALQGFTPASIRNVSLHGAGELGWDDIGGLTDTKETLVETLEWPTKYPGLFASCPLRLRSGLLLYGAPGTGKTLLAGVVAKECGLNFISIKGPELLSKYIGASEQAVRDTFVRAQSAKPCILFFDEFDSIAPRRGHDNTGVTDRVVNQLLTQLDGVEGLDGVYVLAATSRPDLIDPALLRPGRLDKCLLCKLPNQKERLQILEALSRRMSLAQGVDLGYFADHCTDFTGADFKALLYNAQLEAIHEFTSTVEEDSAFSDTGTFGMRSNKSGYASRLKNTKLKLNVDHKKERHRSFTQGTVAFIPSLEEGIMQVSAEMEEKLSTQVSQIRLKERRTSEHYTLDASGQQSPFKLKEKLVVTQDHLLTAVGKMRPSVSGEERFKFQRIYENFVSSRGKHFDRGQIEPGQMKATLA